MQTCIVFTFIGNDKPGLIETISQAVASHGGNWLESKMSQLAGKFAGIIRVSVADDHSAALIDALKALEQQGLSVLIETAEPASRSASAKSLQLSIVGLDRPGIVKEVSQALAQHKINVIEMSSYITSAAMTADPLFNADASIALPDNVDIDDLSDELEDIANELTLDISIDEPKEG